MENKEFLVLIIDDEEDVREFVSYNIKKEGYNVICASNGIDGIRLAKTKRPQLILLDIMIPEMDGIEICTLLRQEAVLSNSIITFLSSCKDDHTILSGYEAGADDYITKPIRPRVLVSKVNSLLRRNGTNYTHIVKTNQVGNLVVDPEKYKVYLSGKPIILPKKEFELLSLLVSKPNKVFSRSEIFSQIWHDDAFVDDKTINVHVRKIREKLGNENIKTIKKVGYKYEYEI